MTGQMIDPAVSTIAGVVASSNGHVQPDTADLLATACQCLAKWQPRLRLMDWDIWIVVDKMDYPDHVAESSKEWRCKRARIIFRPDFLEFTRVNGENSQDETDERLIEGTLVHELLHVSEESVVAMVQREIDWYVGKGNDSGIIGAELRNQWRDYREWWINHMVRTLLEADRSAGWTNA
jgi:hypothetical protein